MLIDDQIKISLSDLDVIEAIKEYVANHTNYQADSVVVSTTIDYGRNEPYGVYKGATVKALPKKNEK